jgi:hypothetical protein
MMKPMIRNRPVEGVEQVNKRILNLIRALPDEIDRATMVEVSDILTEAKRQTPVEFGNLKDSGVITELSTRGSHEMEYQISFGGTEPSIQYAVFVHEDLEAKHPRGGNAKFLENPMEEAKKGMINRIASRIRLERAVGG